jgi:microcystin-dependent protein
MNSPSHSSIETAQNTAITALETKVGVDSSAVTTTIDYLLKSTSSVSPGHKHTSSDITDPTTIMPTGSIIAYGGSSAPTSWLLCDGSLVSRTTYAALFTAISTTYGAGDGSTTFGLPDLRSRIPLGAGAGTFALSFLNTSVNTGTDIITVPTNTSLQTGSAVVLTGTGAAPTGLSFSTTYYVIRASATTLQLASTLANAVAGTQIDITGQGTGTNTLTVTLTNNALGAQGGEETHALVTAELAAHTHGPLSPSTNFFSTGGGAGNVGATSSASNTTTTTGATGGSGAHNNLQPFLTLNYIIRT